MKDQPIISLQKAIEIYKRITGGGINHQFLRLQMELFPHLGLWQRHSDGRPRLCGVRRTRWEYFLKGRFCLYGRGGIFHQSELD